jgi:hypothetical protein
MSSLIKHADPPKEFNRAKSLKRKKSDSQGGGNGAIENCQFPQLRCMRIPVPNEAIHPGEDVCITDADKCTEGVGYFNKSQCVLVRPNRTFYAADRSTSV